MGILKEILAAEKKPEPKISGPEIPPEKNSPCEKCGSPIFWISVYRDGVMRCRECEPPPSPALIGELVQLVDGPGDTPEALVEPVGGLRLMNMPTWLQMPPAITWRRAAIGNRTAVAPQPDPRCPHCRCSLAERTSYVKIDLNHRGWARGDCASCGKTIWPLIPFTKAEASE